MDKEKEGVSSPLSYRTTIFCAILIMLCVCVSCVCAQFPITAIREIKILQQLQHPNIVNLKEIVTTKGTFANHGVTTVNVVTHTCVDV